MCKYESPGGIRNPSGKEALTRDFQLIAVIRLTSNQTKYEQHGMKKSTIFVQSKLFLLRGKQYFFHF